MVSKVIAMIFQVVARVLLTGYFGISGLASGFLGKYLIVRSDRVSYQYQYSVVADT